MLYVVENVEEEIEHWCTLEYQHICQTVGPNKVVFTSIPSECCAVRLASLRRPLPLSAFFAEAADSLEELNWDRVLLLDMDAEEELKVEDAARFDAVLVGGILGNVPSDDRTEEVRRLKPRHSRHLGPLQMTTNTAVLVSKIILEDKIPLSEIPTVDEPEIFAGPSSKESIILPFRYVAKSYLTKQDSDKDSPILPDGLLKFLMESADFALI
ncbi:hypothetical protein Efla_004202 [Eimeria flavescens]